MNVRAQNSNVWGCRDFRPSLTNPQEPKRIPFSLFGLLFFLLAPNAWAMDSIHWVNVDLAGGVAQGVVGGVGITLTVGSNGLIDFYEPNSTEFNASAFTPPLPVAEFIEFTGSPANPRYTLTFSQPVCDLTLHLYSLGSILTFSTTNITKVSGDSLLTVSNNVVTGDLYDTTGHDANGTIFLAGTYTSVWFTAYYTTDHDGVDFQLLLDPVTLAVQPTTTSNGCQFQFTAADELRTYQVETTTLLSPPNWMSLGPPVAGDGTLKSFIVPTTNSPSAFFRLRLY